MIRRRPLRPALLIQITSFPTRNQLRNQDLWAWSFKRELICGFICHEPLSWSVSSPTDCCFWWFFFTTVHPSRSPPVSLQFLLLSPAPQLDTSKVCKIKVIQKKPHLKPMDFYDCATSVGCRRFHLSRPVVSTIFGLPCSVYVQGTVQQTILFATHCP